MRDDWPICLSSFYFVLCEFQEKERVAVEPRRDQPHRLLRLVCNSQSVVLAVTFVKESTPLVWELVHESTWLPSCNTSVPRFWNLQETLPATTRNLVLSPATLPLLSRMTKNWIDCSEMSPSLLVVSFQISTQSFCQRSPRLDPRVPVKSTKKSSSVSSPVPSVESSMITLLLNEGLQRESNVSLVYP